MKWTVRISKKEIHLNVFYLKPENYGCNKKDGFALRDGANRGEG